MHATIYLFQILSSVSTFFSIDLEQLSFNMYTLGTKRHFLSSKSGASP